MKNQNENVSFYRKNKASSEFKVDNMSIEVEYSKNNKSLEECLLNIFKIKKYDSKKLI